MECALTWPLVTCGLSEPGRHNEGFSWITQRGVGFCVFLGEFHLGQVRLELPGGPRRSLRGGAGGTQACSRLSSGPLHSRAGFVSFHSAAS